VLAVYTRPRDPDRPLVCVDETSKQLIAETRVPIPMKPGRPARLDYEYERNGTANLFMMFGPLEGWRHVKVTDRHTAVDYAHVLKDLADLHFANAKTIAGTVLLFAMFVYPRLSGEALFLHTTYSRFVPTMPRCCRQRKPST
jgi:hypothetical protein